MNRNTRTAAKIAAIVVVTLICSLLAYYVSSLISGHSLATESGNMVYSQWQTKFLRLTAVTGVLTGVCSLIWFILSRWVFKIESAFNAGRRTVWALLAAITFIGSICIPRIYSVTLGIKTNIAVIVLFIIFFTVLGYWVLSIFTTPKSFKYTPVGASLFIRHG